MLLVTLELFLLCPIKMSARRRVYIFTQYVFVRAPQRRRRLNSCSVSTIPFSVVLYPPLVSKGNKRELRCSLECKYLNSDDYKDLLWTTLSEFPGTVNSQCQFIFYLDFFKYFIYSLQVFTLTKELKKEIQNRLFTR